MKNIRFFVTCLTLSFLSSNLSYADENNSIKPAKRVIALAPHIVEMLFEFGAGDIIVGTSEHADYPVAAKKIPRVGNYARLNIEQILALAPDLVIAWKTGSPSDDLTRLEALGVNIVYSQPKALEDVATEVQYFAQLTGFQAAGKVVAERFLQRLAEIRQQYQDKSLVRIFYELWPHPLTTTANKGWSQQQLDVCRVENPFVDSATDYPQINVEDVVLAAPEVLIQPNSHSINAPAAINWQQWPHIPAVKNKAFIQPNADKLHRMTSRSLEELVTLCQKIDQFRNK